MLRDVDFYYLQGNIRKQLLKTGLDYLKTASKEVVHKAGEFKRNKIADTITKSNDEKIVKLDKNSRTVEQNNYSTRKKR